ncbi:MAG: hypothetical protein QG597_1563 [Actinomycetota bacterium]|nr:hypothetical protein [Actinomycetota bacterium]
MDETFIAVAPEVLAPIIADPARWPQWWPDLQLTVFMDRGIAGQRWSMVGAMVGSAEIWLEPALDGTTVHFYLRGAPTGPDRATADDLPDTPAGWRRADAIRRRRALDWKRHVWALKDELEGDRPPGFPAPPPDAPAATAH